MTHLFHFGGSAGLAKYRGGNSWRDGTGRYFSSWRDGTVVFCFRGGTGRSGFFPEAGRSGCFFFPRRDGAVVFFFRGGTGRLYLFFEAGRDGVVVFFQRRDRAVVFFVRAGTGVSAAPACGGWPAPLFGCGFKYASITAKHRLRGGVLVSVWERLHQPKTKNYKILCTRLQYDINVQQEREKKRQAVVFVSSFHPRGGVFCCSWRDGAVLSCFRGGTGRFVFFFRGGTGRFVVFFGWDGTGRCFFFLFEGRDGTDVLGGGNCFGGTGQNRYTVPPKAV